MTSVVATSVTDGATSRTLVLRPHDEMASGVYEALEAGLDHLLTDYTEANLYLTFKGLTKP